MKISVIIPAAGQGSRYDGVRSKLDEDLGGRPVLVRTVELFTKRDEIIEIIVAAPPDELDDFTLRYGDRLGLFGAKIVAGGVTERWETVQKALAAVTDKATHVIVHDAARPATHEDVLGRVIEAADKLDAVIPVIPIHSTIKRLGNETIEAADVDPIAASLLGDAGVKQNTATRIDATVDRTNVVEVQTPQIFEVELFKQAYAQDDLAGATDDASLIERLNEPVYAVQGDAFNFKLTTTTDLVLIRKILNHHAPADRANHKRF